MARKTKARSTKPAPPKRVIVHLEDGQWFRITMKQQREMCCDCHLVHDIDYRKRGRFLEFRATQNARATAAARKSFKFTKETE